MKLMVISSPFAIAEEQEIINSLLEEGLEMFQIYKPAFSKIEIENYTRQISARYQNRVCLHSSVPKFHSLKELENCSQNYEYAFLSPIFDSISKKGYTSPFDLNELKQKLSLIKKEIIALGGIDENKIAVCSNLGFSGVAVLGAIWNNPSPLEKFKRLKKICQKKEVTH